MTRVAIGTQSTSTAATSLTTNSPSATAGNVLVLEISWVNSTSDGTTKTPVAPAGWSTALAIASATSAASGRAGYCVFYKTAAGGVESPVFNDPSGGSVLYSHGIISELPAGSTFDSTATSGANSTNNSAASTTGVTVPNTGTLANANSEVFTGVAIIAGTGLANAAIAFSGGSWTTDMSDQDTTASVGALQGYKAVSATTALNAVYTWTGDPSMICYQAGIVVFSTGSTVAANVFQQPQIGPGNSPYSPNQFFQTPRTLGPVPVLLQQPYDQYCALGATATFSVSASPSTVSYQWEDDSSGAFSNVTSGSGGTTATYTTAATDSSFDGRRYRCIVGGLVTSRAAELVTPARTGFLGEFDPQLRVEAWF